MATTKTITKKISRTSKRNADNATVFRGPVVLAATRKTSH